LKQTVGLLHIHTYTYVHLFAQNNSKTVTVLIKSASSTSKRRYDSATMTVRHSLTLYTMCTTMCTSTIQYRTWQSYRCRFNREQESRTSCYHGENRATLCYLEMSVLKKHKKLPNCQFTKMYTLHLYTSH